MQPDGSVIQVWGHSAASNICGNHVYFLQMIRQWFVIPERDPPSYVSSFCALRVWYKTQHTNTECDEKKERHDYHLSTTLLAVVILTANRWYNSYNLNEINFNIWLLKWYTQDVHTNFFLLKSAVSSNAIKDALTFELYY